jgi:predicted acylesterase/phospholipase RssA
MPMTKERVESKSSSTQSRLEANAGLDQTVSEGSTVVLHGSGSPADSTTKLSHFWKQVSDGNYDVNLDNEKKQNLTFKAPYIIDDENSDIVKISTTLRFRLIVSDDNTGKTSGPAYVNITVRRVQRAIIFQGGVALGAYEAGVFRALVKKLIDERRRGLESKKRPLFDIVGGASIGAMNGAIVVSCVTKKGKSLQDEKNWEDSAEKVIEFWKAQEYPWPTVADSLDMNPLYHYWLDIVHNTSKIFKHYVTELIEFYSNMDPALNKWYEDMLANSSFVYPSFLKDSFIDGWYIPATAEAARRYYSAKQIDFLGAPNVAYGILPWLTFGKFFDISELSNIVPRPDNKHFMYYSLKKTLERFADFPIKTKEGEPRYLLVTVDAQTGDAVTFDSYSDEAKYHKDRNTVYNKRGVEIEHALATGTFPDFFDYPKFDVDNSEMDTKDEQHIFWDGGFRSNTPLREVIQAHRDYWLKTKHEKDVPDLEIYIADLWPSELNEDPISYDLDFVENRKWNLLLGDKTDYDEQVANVVTDYVDLARQLKSLAERKGASTEEINDILDRNASSMNTSGYARRYNELLEGRFRLTKVVRIDHKDDANDVAKKIFDYSYKTIEKLMNDGYQDALLQMDIQLMKDGVMELAKRNGRGDDIKKEKDNHHIQKLRESLHQIRETMKMENGNDTMLNNQVENFINRVKSLQDQHESGISLKEEKALLIATAKQFKDTVDKSTTKG